ncbi:MAG: hypothetical protein ACLQBJ_17455 [Bryobacteraceae bacterium]
MKNRLKVLLLSAVAALCLLAVGLVAPACAAAQAAAAPAAQSAVPTDEQIHKLLTEISEITGMALKHPVPIAVLNKEEWRHWVDERMKESAKPEELRVEETAMKMFGFVPPDFDLREATVDLMTEQAAAVYDHKTKRMIIVQGAAPDEMQEAVLVHELSHALADQHFDMHRFLDKGPRSDESDSARLAVVEGQAMWIMLEAMLNGRGQSLKKNSAILELMLPAMRDMAAAQYPVFGKSPLYLKESLLFPYSAGLRFQQAVVDKMGREAFAAVLRDPPKNTHEIIHPELYLEHETPASVELPQYEQRDKTKKLTDGDIGEMDVHVLFEQYASKADADALAPAWRAGRFELLENRATKKPLLRWAILWDTPESAQKAFGLYLKAMEGKSQGLSWKQRADAVAEGSNQYGGFRIQVEGARLEGVEGLP